MTRIIEHALTDATTLTEAGFDALMVENFGDVPFHPDDVPPVTIASMAVVVGEVVAAVGVRVGVNVLRNDGLAAIGIAAATGASMIRVNVLAGTMFTDQGVIDGRAAEIARARRSLSPDVTVLADVFVKHAVPPAGISIRAMANELWERAGADAIVVSGSGTGAPVDLADARSVREAVPDAPLVVGSGADVDSISSLAEVADSVIVGSSLKPGGRTDILVDRSLAESFVKAARSAGFTAER